MTYRVGIWFDERHMAYGGPTAVLLGTILGFYEDANERDEQVILLFNESGDINWDIGPPQNLLFETQHAPNLVVGPLCFQHTDAELCADTRDSHDVWNSECLALFPSDWFRAWVNNGLPYLNPDIAGSRQNMVWSAGVDTDFFSPVSTPSTQDYFIYFKSQRYDNLKLVHNYLFTHYFGIRGTVLHYYNYDKYMLRDVAQKSRFCIMLDRPETQGLAALEIMATGCPIFVLDDTVYTGNTLEMEGATSVTCWDTCCGMKSLLTRIIDDFPIFLTNHDNNVYDPRGFVVKEHSLRESARQLREILSIPWK